MILMNLHIILLYIVLYRKINYILNTRDDITVCYTLYTRLILLCKFINLKFKKFYFFINKVKCLMG